MRVSPIPPLGKLVEQLLDLIISTSDPERSFLPFQGNDSDEVVLLVNNLGGISELEMSGIVSATTSELGKRGIKIHRVLCGPMMVRIQDLHVVFIIILGYRPV